MLSFKLIGIASIAGYYHIKTRDLQEKTNEYKKHVKDYNKSKKQLDHMKNILKGELAKQKTQQIIKNKRFFEEYYRSVQQFMETKFNNIFSKQWIENKFRTFNVTDHDTVENKKFKSAIEVYKNFITEKLNGVKGTLKNNGQRIIKLDNENMFYRSVVRTSFAFNMLDTFWNKEKMDQLINTTFTKELKEFVKNKTFNNYFEVLNYLYLNKELLLGRGLQIPQTLISKENLDNLMNSGAYSKLQELSEKIKEKTGKSEIQTGDFYNLNYEELKDVISFINNNKELQTGTIRTDIFQKGNLAVDKYFNNIEFNNNINALSEDILTKFENGVLSNIYEDIKQDINITLNDIENKIRKEYYSVSKPLKVKHVDSSMFVSPDALDFNQKNQGQEFETILNISKHNHITNNTINKDISTLNITNQKVNELVNNDIANKIIADKHSKLTQKNTNKTKHDNIHNKINNDMSL
jgi:hypothetical protein